MPTVEGGVCAAVLLVRLAHPNLGGFTAVSGWAKIVKDLVLWADLEKLVTFGFLWWTDHPD